ncbi:hypothetical protein C8Q78DRAFT_481575 [Trametes maxima]|nr:hypothetical protein C8Q78DRAFT_481575 [Trametes maxima]
MVKFQAYTVTVGRRIGVFTDWLEVTSSVSGIPGGSYKGYPDCQSALDAFCAAEQRGDVREIQGPSQECLRAQKTRAQGRRPREDDSRAGPRTGSIPSSYSGRTSKSSLAVRDALIAETLDKVRREQRSGSVINARDGGRRTRTASGSTREQPSVARTHTQGTDEQPKPSGSSTTEYETRNASLPPRRTPFIQERRNARSKTSEASTSSSPPTAVTVHEYGSDSAPASPWYAQSLSYASDASPLLSVASPMTGSSALAPSDRRSDVSTPSTGVSKTFPADFAVRPRDIRSSKTAARAAAAARLLSLGEASAAIGSPAVSVSEYGTPSSVEPQLSGLPVPDSLSTVTVRPGATTYPGGAAVRKYSSGMSPAQRRKIGKSYDDAAVQVSPPPRPREREHAEKRAKAVPPKRYATVDTQTSPALWTKAVPLRATASAGDVLDRPGSTCGCEHPEHVCRACGLPPPIIQPVAERVETPAAVDVIPSEGIPTRPVTPIPSPSAANRVMTPESSSAAPSPAAHSPASTPLLFLSPGASVTSPTFKLPLGPTTPSSTASDHSAAGTPLTASPASFHSAVSLPEEAHTPLLGPSERRPDSPASRAASFEEGLRILVRATLARQGSERDADGPGEVLHDTAFDPRSPIQRGTMIPAGMDLEGDMLLRPSPSIVPMNSLLFS